MRFQAIFIVCLFLACPVSAEESGALKINGFGTLGVVHSDNDQADFVTTIVESRGAGYTHSWSAAVDSRLGVQLSYLPTEKLSAVLQVIAEQRDDGVIRPDVEWAYLQYDITPDLSVRLGRTVLPIFLHSQYRKVSYANHWVRPPPEFYVVPVNTSDGISVLFNHRFGEVNYTLNGVWGQGDQDQAGDIRSEAKNTRVIANTFEYGHATLRFAYANTDLTANKVNELFDAFRVFGAQGAAIADKYNFDDKMVRNITVGGSYDPGSWFVMSEWLKSKSDSFLGENEAWYVSGGYRLGKFTPYLTYSQTRSINDSNEPKLNTASVPPFLTGLAVGLNGVLDALTRPVDQKTISLGTRWDFAENAAFKIQYDHINLGDNSSGTLANVQPDFKLGGTVNLLSLVVDFTF